MLKIALTLARFHRPVRFFSQAIACNSSEDLARKWGSVERSLQLRGYVLLQGKDAEISTLSNIAKLFGAHQSHSRNRTTGITDIIGECKANSQNRGQVISNKEFLPHTDGTYLHGMMYSNGKYYRVGPPKFILLQCIRPASDGGGMSIIIDGKKILTDIIQKEPALLPVIFSPTCIKRGEHLTMDVPIYQQRRDGSYAIRFSYDADLFYPKRLESALAYFNQHYVMDDRFKASERLQRGSILVVDNLRSLHARTAFASERHFRRLWIHDDGYAEEMTHAQRDQSLYYESPASGESPLKKYEQYKRISGAFKGTKPLPTGIFLSSKIRNRLLNFHGLWQRIGFR